VCVAFILDVHSRVIVSWQLADHLRTDLVLATIEWIDWYNHRRLHRELGLIPPAEHEAAWHHKHTPELTAGATSPHCSVPGAHDE
jgi:transposase InsO family protein